MEPFVLVMFHQRIKCCDRHRVVNAKKHEGGGKEKTEQKREKKKFPLV